MHMLEQILKIRIYTKAVTWGAKMINMPISDRSEQSKSEEVNYSHKSNPYFQDYDPGRANVLLLDKRALSRECFAALLNSCDSGVRAKAFASIEDWFQSEDVNFPVSVVLLNIGNAKLSDQGLAHELTRAVAKFGSIPLVVLGDVEELMHIIRAIECGVRGYIPSSVGISICIEALKLTIAGGIYIPANSVVAMSKVIEGNEAVQPFAGMFTPRQAEVLMALRQGKANKIIAYELNMRESTVKVHIRNIMRKLRCTNRTEVAFKINDILRPDSAPRSADV